MRAFLADLLLVLFIATLAVGVGSNASAGKGEDVRFRRRGGSAAIGADTLLTDTLRRLIESARHPYLRWPNYPDYRVELEALYSGSGYGPIWLENDRPTTQAQAAIDALLSADTHGLRPDDYDAPRLAAVLDSILAGEPIDGSGLALFDAALSVGFLRFLESLYRGRVNPGNLHLGFDLAPPRPDLAAVLGRAIERGEIEETVARTAPGSPRYARLRGLLAVYRELAAREPPSVPVRPVVRPGDAYEGTEALRQRLVALGDLPTDAARPGIRRYDGPIVAAVECFQARHGLEVDGVLGRETFAALNTPIAARVEQIELAMERMRWTREVEDTPAVFVNIPAFGLRVFDPKLGEDRPVLEMRVVVGAAVDKQTPAFRSDIRYIEFSPYWNVPYSIAVAEVLPAIARNRDYLASHRMEIVREFSPDAEALPQTAENLAAVRSGRLKLRQLPGPGNSLGGAKFIFPNPKNVYLHATPATQLFARSRRDFSHGCIRLEDPVALAEWLLNDQQEWTRERIEKAMHAGSPLRVDLLRPVPVVIVYTTVTVNGDQPHFYGDVYGHDAHLRAALSVGYPYPA